MGGTKGQNAFEVSRVPCSQNAWTY